MIKIVIKRKLSYQNTRLYYQFLIIHLNLLSFQNIYGICEQSKFTIREVSNCPKNYSEWTQRAQKLKCHTVLQNCSSRQRFVYHCLPNSFWNRTIELCAPRKYINLRRHFFSFHLTKFK